MYYIYMYIYICIYIYIYIYTCDIYIYIYIYIYIHNTHIPQDGPVRRRSSWRGGPRPAASPSDYRV